MCRDSILRVLTTHPGAGSRLEEALIPVASGNAEARRTRRLFIFNFHGIGQPAHSLPASEQRVWVEAVLFQTILDCFRARNDVAFTFDDANESDYRIALPALQTRGLRAQFFLVADRIGGQGYLSVQQAQVLVDGGMTIGSHGMRHRRWPELSDADFHQEVIVAKDRLEQMIGKAIDVASCPYGSYNRRVLRALRTAGYRRVYTSDGGWASADAFVQPRNSVHGSDGLAAIQSALDNESKCFRMLWQRAKQVLKQWR